MTGLNASAGISYNKYLAKMASDFEKAKWSIFHYPKTWTQLRRGTCRQQIPRCWSGNGATHEHHGIETGADLKSKSLQLHTERFGKSGPYFYGIARGTDQRKVRPDRVRKSGGAEETVVEDIHDLNFASVELRLLAERVWRHCEANRINGETVTVKIKYSDVTQAMRSRTAPLPYSTMGELFDTSFALLTTASPYKKPLRLLGICLSSLTGENSGDDHQPQLDLDL